MDAYGLFLFFQTVLSITALTAATVAAYQIARYYGHRNRQIEEGATETPELEATVRRAVAEATAPLKRDLARLQSTEPPRLGPPDVFGHDAPHASTRSTGSRSAASSSE